MFHILSKKITPLKKEITLSSINPMENPELITHIANYLDEQDPSLSINAHSSFVLTSVFFHEVLQSSLIARNLLLLTTHGEEDKVKKLFKIAPMYIKYLTARSEVLDYSQRKFTGISAFQYALWARDTRMLAMMLDSLNKAETKAVSQAEYSKFTSKKKTKLGLITQEEINQIKETLLQQYKEVVDVGMNYS